MAIFPLKHFNTYTLIELYNILYPLQPILLISFTLGFQWSKVKALFCNPVLFRYGSYGMK